ncbi:peptidase inhibitor family I36 protein [Micromonospora rubida]
MFQRALSVLTRPSQALAVAATTAAALLAISSPAAAVVTPSASYADCPASNACFYTGSGGSGSMCNWSDADPDWTSGIDRCSWARTAPARSVYNRGTSTSYTAVAFYTGTYYNGYNGCMGQGWQGNIGPVYLLSHKWITSPC